MTVKTMGLAALSAALVLGLAGGADAASAKKQHHAMMKRHHAVHHAHIQRPAMMGGMFSSRPRIVRNNSGIGRFVISPGDSRAAITRAYPNDQNPRSLRETYNLRGRAMNENRN